jgi:hypothetical protein
MHTYSRRLLDDLLVSTLNGAVTLEQMDHIAVLVRKHLEFNVSGPVHIGAVSYVSHVLQCVLARVQRTW